METNVKIIEKNKVKIKKPKHYNVIMHNDDFTTMEFVIEILISIFNKKIDEANKIMLSVHKEGKGTAGIYPYDIAVSKANTSMEYAKKEGFPFKLTVEEE